MSDFNVRSDSVDVEQIMNQIRARIREKRGVDYTEQQIRELAEVKLEKLLDPRGVRSDLLTRFKERQPAFVPPLLPLYVFEDTTMYETHRGVLRWIRKVLSPIVKLFFNPNVIVHALHSQVEINKLNLEREAGQEKRRIEMETLYYELVHNLVFELTRLGIESKNLKLRVESIASRLEFNERRARALESVVAYKASDEADTAPEGGAGSGSRAAAAQPPQQAQPASLAPGQIAGPEGPGQRSRRRRRRRGRRGGQPASVIMGGLPGSGHLTASGPEQRQPGISATPNESATTGPVTAGATPAEAGTFGTAAFLPTADPQSGQPGPEKPPPREERPAEPRPESGQMPPPAKSDTGQ